MKMYFLMGFVGALMVGAYMLYKAGFEKAELQNQAAAAHALREAYVAEAERSEAERTARQAAEERAKELEEDARRRALLMIANREDNPQCPEICYSLEWP